MRRTPDTSSGRPEVQLHDVTTADTELIERAVEAFRASTNHAVDGIADLVLRDFRAGHLSAEVIERLSKWTNSDGSFTSAVDPARKLGHLLLGCPLDRLIDEHGKRVSDYSAKVTDLARQIGFA